MGSVVAERDIVGVFGAVVEVPVLAELVDGKPEEDAGQDPLPESTLDQVESLVVDPVQLLQTLQVVLLGWCVCDGPHAEVVHVRQKREAVLEGDLVAHLFTLNDTILEVRLHDVVRIPDRLTGLLEGALENSKLAAHFCF